MLDARYNLADAMFREGRFEQAARHFSMVVNKNPNDFEAQNNLGVAYLELSRFREAIEHLQAALKIRPDLQDAKDNLETAIRAAEGKKR
jgi:Flp pilus assembly protein TadD